MKLGAQFYTLRKRTQTKEGLEECFRAMSAIGYEAAQMSAIGPVAPEDIRDMAEKYALPVTCTHSPYDRIIGDTEKLIEEHKIYGCPVIGLGSMPGAYISSAEGVRAFIAESREAAKKIRAAGLRFAYHNHYKEFSDVGGTDIFDILFSEFPELDFIADVYWMAYAGRDPLTYIRRIGRERMTNIHFKDMKSLPKGDICPCGAGVLDFAAMARVCEEEGIENALVEQDNAPELGDEFEQMKFSYEHLRPLIKRK